MLATVILIVCLAGGGACREETVPGEYPYIACVVQGQFIAREWLEEHPNLRLRAWRCKVGKEA